MTDDQLKTALRIWAQTGQIERYKVPLVSNEFKTLLSGIIIGVLLGGFWALVLSFIF